MALIKCHECGHDVSTDASSCPSCGAKMPKIRKSLSPIVKWGLLGTVALGVVGAVLDPAGIGKSPPRTEAEDRLGQARTACAEFVKKSLHDPGSAEFESLLTDWAKEVTPSVFNVQTHVKAKNAFNATRKSVMDCRVQLSERNWKLLSLKEIK